MTSIIIPDFIFKLFTQKILEINNMIINKMCEHYNLDIDEAHKFLEKEMKIKFKIIGEDIEQVKIVKKHKKKEKQNDTNESSNALASTSSSSSCYCDARVFLKNELIVKQCSRCKLEGSSFCKIHHKLNQNGQLKYGTIHEAKPDSISTEKLNMKVKRTIY